MKYEMPDGQEIDLDQQIVCLIPAKEYAKALTLCTNPTDAKEAQQVLGQILRRGGNSVTLMAAAMRPATREMAEHLSEDLLPLLREKRDVESVRQVEFHCNGVDIAWRGMSEAPKLGQHFIFDGDDYVVSGVSRDWELNCYRVAVERGDPHFFVREPST